MIIVSFVNPLDVVNTLSHSLSSRWSLSWSDGDLEGIIGDGTRGLGWLGGEGWINCEEEDSLEDAA